MKILTRIKLALVIIFNKQSIRNDKIYWFNQYYTTSRLLERAERALKIKYGDKAEYVKHISDLEKKNKILKRQVRSMQLKAEEFNRTLYATGYLVNCTGCWDGRPYKAEELTEVKVEQAEWLVKRLRTWWENHKYREKNARNTKSNPE